MENVLVNFVILFMKFFFFHLQDEIIIFIPDSHTWNDFANVLSSTPIRVSPSLRTPLYFRWNWNCQFTI